jgi:hypothetical protein
LRDDQQKQQLLSLLKWMQTSSISSLSSIIATIEHSLTFALFNERFPDAIIHYICMTFIHFKEVPILMQVNRRFHSILPRQLLVSSNTAFNLIFTGASHTRSSLLVPIQHLRLTSLYLTTSIIERYEQYFDNGAIQYKQDQPYEQQERRIAFPSVTLLSIEWRPDTDPSVDTTAISYDELTDCLISFLPYLPSLTSIDIYTGCSINDNDRYGQHDPRSIGLRLATSLPCPSKLAPRLLSRSQRSITPPTPPGGRAPTEPTTTAINEGSGPTIRWCGRLPTICTNIECNQWCYSIDYFSSDENTTLSSPVAPPSTSSNGQGPLVCKNNGLCLSCIEAVASLQPTDEVEEETKDHQLSIVACCICHRVFDAMHHADMDSNKMCRYCYEHTNLCWMCNADHNELPLQKCRTCTMRLCWICFGTSTHMEGECKLCKAIRQPKLIDVECSRVENIIALQLNQERVARQ